MNVITIPINRKTASAADPKDKLKQKLVSIRQKSAERLKEKINSLARAWHGLFEADTDSIYLREMHAICHTVAGNGLTLGFPILSRLAGMLETLLTCVIDHDRKISREVYEQLGFYVLALQQSAEQIDIGNLPADMEEVREALKRKLAINEKLVYWLGPLEQDQALIQGLGEGGYQVMVFQNWHELDQAAQEHPPELVISSLEAEVQSATDTASPTGRHRLMPQSVPLLCIVQKDSFESRLRLVHQGATDILVRPLQAEKLLPWLEQHRISTHQNPFRVLVVDDDIPLSNYYAFILREAGMVVEVVNQPIRILDALFRFQPEMVIMDVYMPEWNGVDVATVIRQYDEFATLPIVFLSRESDLEIRLTALERGGDNFLTKPISPGHLVSVVAGRIGRFRRLQMKKVSLLDTVTVPAVEEHLANTVMAESVVRLKKGIDRMMEYLHKACKGEAVSQEDVLEDLNSTGLIMQEELSNMIFLNDIKSGRELLELENFDLGELLVECCRAICPAAEKRNIRIRILESACMHNCYVKADYGKSTEILLTLLGNVLQHCADQGQIEVDCIKHGNVIRVMVSTVQTLSNEDDCLLVADEGVLHFGANLVVVQALVRVMGGDFGIQSIQGHGPMFWIDLPSAYRNT